MLVVAVVAGVLTWRPDPKDEFLTALQKEPPDVTEIRNASRRCFRPGRSAKPFAEIFAKANKKSARGNLVDYEFWLEGKDPLVEGDYWVSVRVDPKKQLIFDAGLYGLLK